MDKDEPPQKAELTDGKVCRVGGLGTLLAREAHAHMRRDDHGDVVGPIADGKRGRIRLVVLDELDDIGLLLGRHPAADHGPATHGHLQKPALALLRGQGCGQCRTCDRDGRPLTLHGAVEFLLNRGGAGIFNEDVLHILGEQPARPCDADRSFHLVARENPDADSREAQLLDGFGHLVLQPVLDGRGAQELQGTARLQLLGQARDLLSFVGDQRLRLRVAGVPSVVMLLAKCARGEAQRPQAALRKGGQVFLAKADPTAHVRKHRRVRPLQQQLQTTVGKPHYAGAALAVIVKVADVQDVHGKRGAVCSITRLAGSTTSSLERCSQGCATHAESGGALGHADELKAHGVRHVDKCQLVRRGSVVERGRAEHAAPAAPGSSALASLHLHTVAHGLAHQEKCQSSWSTNILRGPEVSVESVGTEADVRELDKSLLSVATEAASHALLRALLQTPQLGSSCRGVAARRLLLQAVDATSHAARLVLHDILRQRPRLVREDMRDLPQRLENLACVHLRSLAMVHITTTSVPCKEHALRKLHACERHNQGDWHHAVRLQQPRARPPQRNQQAESRRTTQIPSALALPDHGTRGQHHTDDELHRKDHQDHSIEFHVQLAGLEPCAL
mmetsp:Transcript_82026/g.240803  ORF Transcript_82026/g.240803 Transcript_82026/m.240803 type:complete len:619 (-) Transcript_82026:845-2701(-)